MDEDEITWADPPPDRRGQQPSQRQRFVATLQKNPGRWAQYEPGHQHSSSLATAFKALGCEATTRKRDDGGYDVYVRWPE